MEMVLPEYMRKVYIIISKQIKTNDYTSVSKNIKIVSVHPPPLPIYISALLNISHK